MKRTLAFLAAIMMLLSMLTLTSCKLFSKNKEQKRNGKGACEIYLDAAESIYCEESLTFTSVRIFSIVEGDEIRQVTETVTLMCGSGEDTYLRIETSDDANSTVEVWYKGGTMYSSSPDGRFKAQISYDEFKATYMYTDGFLDIPEEWLKMGEFDERNDGSFLITVTVDGEDYLAKYGNTMPYLSGNTESAGDTEYRITFSPDGTLCLVVITAHGRDAERSCSTHTTWSVSDIGRTEIDIPDGTFIDITESI